MPDLQKLPLESALEDTPEVCSLCVYLCICVLVVCMSALHSSVDMSVFFVHEKACIFFPF